ncbi:hypothetical protein PMAYCL1PPCAC_25232, partial [Pristionchus mayeri]
PVFNAMFYGNFTERNKKEIELKGVDREGFHVMLKILCNPIFEIEEDMRLLESLLVLGNLYDIKAVIDRVEDILCKTDKLSPEEKLLFADKHNSFRFIKLNIVVDEVFGEFNTYTHRLSIAPQMSNEYLQLSLSTKSVCEELLKNFSLEKHSDPEKHRLEEGRISMIRGENLMESIDEKDLVASGCFRTLFEFEADHNSGGIISSCGHNNKASNWIGGLLWVLDARCDIHRHADGENRYLLSFMLVVNEDQRTIFDWKAEGIIEIEPIFRAKGIVLMDESDPTYSTMVLDKSGKRINYDSENPYPIKKQFTFALDNNNRKGLTSCVCLIMNKQGSDWRYPGMCLKTRIHLTKVTGKSQEIHVSKQVRLRNKGICCLTVIRHFFILQYLSTVSTVFRTLFDDNSSDTANRLVLNDVKYQDCIEFLRWIYPSDVKNLEEDSLSRVVALAKRFNVIFVINQIARFLRLSPEEYAYSLQMVLHFGYAVDLQFHESLDDNVYEHTDWKSISKQIENTAAYKEMEDGKGREMLEWMIKNWTTADES